jgi:Adhesin biosynthesis transcription regulatory protein
MRHLIQGGHSQEQLDLLLKLTRISSDSIKSALSDYLVLGRSDSLSAAKYDVLLPNFTKALVSLNKTTEIVEGLIEIRVRHLKSVK